jgi:predicted amidohydrolase YtcJ
MSTTVFRNANVITCDARGTIARALAIEEGRIVAVGDEKTVTSRVGPTTETVDLQGATVLPGMIDTHPHLMHFGALAEPLVDLSDAPRTRTSPTGSPSEHVRRRKGSGS